LLESLHVLLLFAYLYCQVKQLEHHIELGCVSDVPGIPLYYPRNSSDGSLPHYICVRGTNGLEGYHLYLRKVLGCHRMSPLLAHCLLLEFNHRWCMRMAISRRGMSEELSGVYDTPLVEALQHMTADWWPLSPLFSDWPSTRNFADNGERFGLATGLLTPSHRFGEVAAAAQGPVIAADSLADDGVDAPFCSSEPADSIAALGPLSLSVLARSQELSLDLPPSAVEMAALMRVQLPVTPVRTKQEYAKCKREFRNYLRSDGVLDVDTWAKHWNQHCFLVERGTDHWAGVCRKTAGHLTQWYKKQLERDNRMASLRPHLQEHHRLVADLREPGPLSKFAGSVGAAALPALPQPPASLALSAAASAQHPQQLDGGSASGSAVALSGVVQRQRALEDGAASDTVALAGADAVQGVAAPSSSAQPAASVAAARPAKRGGTKAKSCLRCGHVTDAFAGLFHIKPARGRQFSCTVPDSRKRQRVTQHDAGAATATGRQLRAAEVFGGICTEPCCAPYTTAYTTASHQDGTA
jgi:hypothetical protein